MDYSEDNILVFSQYEEVHAEQLQRLLNDQILKGLENTCTVAVKFTFGLLYVFFDPFLFSL